MRSTANAREAAYSFAEGETMKIYKITYPSAVRFLLAETFQEATAKGVDGAKFLIHLNHTSPPQSLVMTKEVKSVELIGELSEGQPG